MTRALITRLARLESRTSSQECRVTVRFGHLKRLPPEYVGERHIIVARELPNQGEHEWVEFEEMPGADPDSPEPVRYRGGRPISSRLDVVFVAAYPQQEGMAG
jgi:hypothetical protein